MALAAEPGPTGGDGVTVTAALLFATAAGLMVTVVPDRTVSAWSSRLAVIRDRLGAERRRSEFDVELIDALGEMVMGVEAGLTLDAVLTHYVERHDSPVAREFRHLLDRVRVGTSRRDALREFAERNTSTGARSFVSAVEQNQTLGTPLAGVLRQQASTERRRRRQAVEEKAAKLSLKMVFPTVFCVLPVLLIVVVGPAIIRLLDTLPG